MSAGECEERGDRDHVQLLGRVGPPAPGPHEEGQRHPAVPPEVSRDAAQGVQRPQGRHRRPAHVREGGPHHSPPLPLLRLHRHQGPREERAAL